MLSLAFAPAMVKRGRGGIRRDKTEGDGATPVGSFALRRLLYRPDRVTPPQCDLETDAIGPEDGWCDDPAHADYNRQIALPHPASHERLWRDDALYDLLVVLGHNDSPAQPGHGSAIFLHVARSDYGPTEGCVALARSDLEGFLTNCRAEDRLHVKPPPSR